MNELNFIDLLENQLQRFADKDAFVFLADGEQEKDKLTYFQLVQKSKSIAAHLQQRAKLGDRILLCYLPGMDFICAFLGCLYAGMVAVPTYPLRNNHHAKRLLTIINDCSTQLVLGTCESLAQMQQQDDFKSYEYILTDNLENESSEYQPVIISPEKLAFLQYTSGSTGDPKGVMVSHGNLLANQRAILDVFHVGKDDKIISWLPMQHDMGLIGHLFHTIYCGTTEIFMSPAVFLEKPLRWLQAISYYRGYACGGPNFGYQLCVDKVSDEQLTKLDLSSWRSAFNGSEPVRPSTLKSFAEKFAPCGFKAEFLLPCYGMAETTLLVSGVTKIHENRTININKTALAAGQFQVDSTNAIALASSGQVDKSYILKIVNPTTKTVAKENEIGEIWVCGDSVALGYWNKPDLTEEIFHAQLENDANHYLRTGDLGYLHNDNLYVTGRLKDLIILQGQNIYPQDVERAVENCHPAIRAHCTAAFAVEVNNKEQLVIVAEVERTYRKIDFQPVFAAIRQAVIQAVDAIPYSIHLLQPAKAFRTTSGKIQRRATKAAYEAGTLEILAHDELFKTSTATILTYKQLEMDICGLLAKVLGVEKVDAQQPFNLLGGTSLEAVTFQQQLQTYIGNRLTLSPTIAFDYPTVKDLTDFLYSELTGSTVAKEVPKITAQIKEPIVIIGMSCRFPGHANDPESFWQLLATGSEGISIIPSERFKAHDFGLTTQHGGFIDDIDRFDASFFNISPREAEMMDPQQRLLLEESWKALENAGIDPSTLRGSDTGVFIGATSRDYGDLLLRHNANDSYLATGNNASVLSGRLSYTLGLQGPSLTLDTACSSSLVAVREAYHSLQRGDIQLAIVGGVNALLSPDGFINLSQANMLAQDGHCKVFAENADGYVRGEGCGVVILKRLTDAEHNNDEILAIIKSIVVNQDGASSGLTVPNGVAQEKLLKQALSQADLQPSDIDYIELHGTGTKLGDPMETHVITGVYCESHHDEQPLYLGSVKANVGHLEAGAGMAGLIKVMLCMQHKQLPPQPTIIKINSKINLTSIPAKIVEEVIPWAKELNPRRAAISSFSFSGTNAHLVLEEAIQKESDYIPKEIEPNAFLLTFSAKTSFSLQQQIHNYSHFLEKKSFVQITDLSYTQHVGRQHFPFRYAIVANTIQELQIKLGLVGEVKANATKVNHKIAFILSDNNGKTLTNLHTLLKSSPVFSDAYTKANAVFKNAINDNMHTAVQTFCLQYALSALWQSWGIIPDKIIGFGVGAFVADVLNNKNTLEAAVKKMVDYVAIMVNKPLYKKSLVVFADLDFVQNCLKNEFQDLFVTEIHSNNEVILSGPYPILQELFTTLKTKKFSAQWLSAVCRPGEIIHFNQIEKLFQENTDIFIEIGHEPLFLIWGQQHFKATWAASLHPSKDPWHALMQNLAILYQSGLNIDWKSFEAPYKERRRKIQLPTYAFQRERHWAKVLESKYSDSLPRTTQSSAPIEGLYEISWSEQQLDETEQVHEFITIDSEQDYILPENIKHLVYIAPINNEVTHTLAFDFAQVIAKLEKLNKTLFLWIITRQAYMVDGSNILIENTPLNGLIKSARLEHPNIIMNQIDVEEILDQNALLSLIQLEINQLSRNILIAYRNSMRFIARLNSVNLTSYPAIKFDKHANYIITGGLGELGFALSAWLIKQGVRYLVLVARKNSTAEQEEQFKKWREQGVKIIIENCDLSQKGTVYNLIKKYKHGLYPLKGIFHLAGALHDAPLIALTQEHFAKVFAAKALGAWYLHQALEENNLILDYFVLFSSFASLNGSPGQGNYAAANAFLDGLAYYRRLHNLAAISINWGPWSNMGMAKNSTTSHERSGLVALMPEKAFSYLNTSLAANKVQIGIFNAHWDQIAKNIPSIKNWLLNLITEETAKDETNHFWKQLQTLPREQQKVKLQNMIVDKLKGILNLSPESLIDLEQSFFTLGLDSLMGLQLINQLRKVVGEELEIKYENVLQKNSVRLLADYLLDKLHFDTHNNLKAITVVDRSGCLPLSFSQERLWFLQQLDPKSCSYNEVAAIKIQGNFNKKIVGHAYKKLIERHESLRTRFVQENDMITQKIETQVDWRLDYRDLRTLPDNERKYQLEHLLDDIELKPFDLTQAGLFRVLLIQLKDDYFVLAFTLHHIIADGWSVGILAREFVQVYNALSAQNDFPLPFLSVQYADYAHWQREYLQGEVLKQHLQYWQHQLSDLPMLNLPLDFPRPKILNDAGLHHPLVISKDLASALKELCAKHDISLYMLLLSSLYLLLSRYSAQTDICIGSPIANRTRPEIESVIGVFINMIVLRINADPTITFEELLQQVKNICLQAYAHQDVPFEKVVEAVVTDRNMSHTALFDVMLVLQNAPLDPVVIQDLSFELMPNNTKIAKFDLTFELMQLNGEFKGYIEYRTSLFKPETIAQLGEHFINLLTNIISTANQKLANIDFLNQAEKNKLIYEFNQTNVSYSNNKTACQIFEEIVEKFPEEIALIYDEQALTYRELNHKANQLAHYLHTLNINSEVMVGICIHRSIEMVVGLLGILKAGGAYVPIDPNYPEERIQYMLEDAKVKICLTEKSISNKLKRTSVTAICLEEVLEEIKNTIGKNLILSSKPKNIAYVIYTSGSTGKPKGVMITNEALICFIEWLTNFLSFVKPLRYLHKTPFSFDVCVSDIFTPLLSGGTLVLAAPGEQLEPNKLIQRIKKHQITCVELIPNQLALMLDEEDFSRNMPLQVMMTGGEALTDSIAQKFNKMCDIPLINSYGPTECTVTSLAAFIAANDSKVTIGKPINNIQAYILDAFDNLAPLGAVGELCLAGTNLARGYFNRPDLTAEKFQPNPFGEPGSRLYRTGDLVRYLSDGRVEYLGRIDQQVKIRGFRIELGEIETVLNQHLLVESSLVVAHGNSNLIAYITFKNNDIRAEVHELRNYLAHQLPDYMVPAFFVYLDAFPLNPTGKIDRNALLQYDHLQNHKTYIAPRNEIEKTLTTIFAEVLNIEKVGIDDNFFELGGHSLLAVKVMTALRKTLQRDIPLSVLFQTSTVRQVAEIISATNNSSQALMCLQSQGVEEPLFLLPGTDGFGMVFAELAREMGHQRPVYTLQTPNLFEEKTFLNLESLAGFYIEQIKRVQKSGPYYLCGWSMGGIVAYEMTKQLEKSNQKVAYLGIIDITPKSVKSSELTQKQFFMGLLADERFGVKPEILPNVLEELKKIKDESLIDFIYEKLVAAQSPLIIDGKNRFEKILHVFKENDQILSRYTFDGKVEKMIYFPATEAYLINNKVAMRTNIGNAKPWQSYCRQTVIVQPIIGNHFTMLRQPYVKALAKGIINSLNTYETTKFTTDCPS